MSNYYTLITQYGAADLTAAQAFHWHVPLTHIAVGDGNGAAVTPTEAMTELVHETYRASINNISVDADNPNWLLIEAVIPASIGGWTIREIGLIGGLNTNNAEISETTPGNKLLAVGNFPDTYKPLLVEGAAKDLNIRMIIEVSNASTVNLTIDPSVTVATKTTVKQAIAEHNYAEYAHPELQTAVQQTNDILAGVHTTILRGDLLSRVIPDGMTTVSRSLFAPGVVFIADKTTIFDVNGTEGVVVAQDETTITVVTKSTSPLGSDEPTLLTPVSATYAALPKTVTAATALYGRTPKINDYTRVTADEQALPAVATTERYITAIDGQGNIAWGSYFVLNTSDYQAQTGAADSGKLLTGGATAGTFGTPIDPNSFVSSEEKSIPLTGLVNVTTDASTNTTAFSAQTYTFPNLMIAIWRKINALFTLKANLASPTFTGTPAAPTAAAETNNTQLATTAFVKNALGAGTTPTFGGVGSLCFASPLGFTELLTPGSTIAGSLLQPACIAKLSQNYEGIDVLIITYGNPFSGTWQVLGVINYVYPSVMVSLFQRIA